MTEPVAVGVERFFEFIERPGLSVLLVSVHPRHTFSAALSRARSRVRASRALTPASAKLGMPVMLMPFLTMRTIAEERSTDGIKTLHSASSTIPVPAAALNLR